MKTDLQLQQDVIAELKWEPSINSALIGVEVKNGVVTLTGHVDSFAEKWSAEQAAERVSGVTAMAVEMDVNLPGASRRHDSDIARSAENVLLWLSYLPNESIKVKVEGGWITLSGEVEWEYQRRAAAGAVRNLMGVTGISDHVSLKPRTSVESVKSDIEAALKRRAASDAQAIAVDVRGSDVTLSGNVSSWAERSLARRAASDTPGVRNVVDNMIVSY